MKTLIGEAPPKSIRTAASIAGRLILTAQSSSSSTATVGTGNSTRPSDIGFCNTSLTISNRKTRGAIIDHAASGCVFIVDRRTNCSQLIGLRKEFLSSGKPRFCRALPRQSQPLRCGRMM